MKNKSLLNRKVQLAFGSAIVILLVVGSVSYRGMAISKESDRLVRHTHEVIENLQDLLLAVEGIETSDRGFVLTGKESPIINLALPQAWVKQRAAKFAVMIALSGLAGRLLSNGARLRRVAMRRRDAIKYLQKSNLEDLDVLLQAIDYALLLPRDDEFSETAFFPNLPEQSKRWE